MVRVKICGITNWPDAKLALDAGANALGFNFYGPSPRFVPVPVARRIVRHLPQGIEAVGVFVDDWFQDMRDIAEIVGLGMLQLHGKESPRAVARCAQARPVIKAFRVGPGFRLASLAKYSGATFFLLDGFKAGAKGGTGRPFDWRIARTAKRYGRIFLAGGLTPENVAQAVREVEPFAVDVCTGIEAKPGKKDPARLREFMQQVEAARRELK